MQLDSCKSETEPYTAKCKNARHGVAAVNRTDHHCPYDPGSEFDRVQEHHLHFDRASEEDGTKSDDRFQAILAVASTGCNWPISAGRARSAPSASAGSIRGR
jgi:hypothetical protein